MKAGGGTAGNGMGLRPSPEQVIRRKIRRAAGREEISYFIIRLAAMAAMLTVMFGLLFGIAPVKDNDMFPKLAAGDLILYYRLEREFRAQDVVVFQKDGRRRVGRVAAAGGDSAEVTGDGRLLINGSAVTETDIFYSTFPYDGGIAYPVKLKDHQYFVLCDYRDGARDSRYFGPVDVREIRGKVLAALRRSGL